MPDTQALTAYFSALQRRLVAACEAVEAGSSGVSSAAGADRGALFRSDPWRRDDDSPLSGEGVTAIIEGGSVFERGGVAYSHVAGAALPPAASARRPELAGCAFEAMGVSLVLHPENPYCPTAHLNVRALIARRAGQAPVAWFGGGMDLTPYYPYADDIRHFHGVCKQALTPFGDEVYGRCKRDCDAYFFIKHRNEPRGVGGIFFDDLTDAAGDGATSFERAFALTRAVGDAFAAAYLPLVDRRRQTPYGERERDFQAYRRGRYVEFNLVCDRGTLFGLQSGGRTESILMSLPPVVKWRYDWSPEPGSAEALIYDYLPPRDWV